MVLSNMKEEKSSNRRFFSRPPVWGALLAIIAGGLIFWWWDEIALWAVGVFDIFGWGLVLLGLAILVLIIIAFWPRISSFLRHLKHINIWLGGVAVLFTLWGVLGLFNLGGNIGQAIIGNNGTFLAVLRVFGLLILAIVFLIPRQFAKAITNAAKWIYNALFKRKKSRTLLGPPAMPVKSTGASETISRTNPAVPPPLEKEVRSSQNSDLKQVAREVWQRYGASSSLKEVDGWKLPPPDILDETPEVSLSDADNKKRAAIIEDALASYGVDARVVQINVGPTVTQFGVEPGWDIKTKEVRERDRDGNIVVKPMEISRTRVKVDRITSLANDLALALAAPSIRIEAPVPGKSMVGIEVPNVVSSTVSLRSVVESSAFQKILARSKLAIALGKGAGGEAIAADLTKMPHLLIAGATGSGKTVCLNVIIASLLLHNAPTELRFVLIDPKRVELVSYNTLPHLATPVIVDAQKAIEALHWLQQEMDNRYKKFATMGARNIEAYNKSNPDGKMPYIVLVIDELADLMMAGFEEVEEIICRLAQLARATGIHLVVATQRPSVDVITGLIKANFPTRISFAVTSQVDSRTILDTVGAEKLLGRGDMLYLPTEAAKPKRLQGCYISDAEIERLVYFWNSQKPEGLVSLKVEDLSRPQPKVRASTSDPLLDAARELLEEHGTISASYLQRKLRIGYPRAARLVEELQNEGHGED